MHTQVGHRKSCRIWHDFGLLPKLIACETLKEASRYDQVNGGFHDQLMNPALTGHMTGRRANRDLDCCTRGRKAPPSLYLWLRTVGKGPQTRQLKTPALGRDQELFQTPW